MTWNQIRSAADKQGLSCKQVYELVVGLKPTTKEAEHGQKPTMSESEIGK